MFGRHPVRAVGIPWYARQDYRRILEIMTDADVLPATYDQWIRKAEGVERDLKRKGMIVVRAVIDPNTFPAFCRSRGLDVDADGRNRFASEEAARAVGQTH